MFQLRPYQREAVEATLAYFRSHRDPALIVLPTGSGKSLVIAELARIARGRVLVLAHVKELVEQNHAKFQNYSLDAGIYSAGLDRKDFSNKVIFGSIQSVARGKENFFRDFSLLIIDECHRVSMEGDSQYRQVIERLRTYNPQLCVLGLTATPYRLGLGWIYQYHARGVLRTQENRFFRVCLYELPIAYLIKKGYLTAPIQIDSPVACYDFSSLPKEKSGFFSIDAIDRILKDQKRITPSIVANILELSRDRQGVMIFTSTLRHAKEVMECLPKDASALILGDTDYEERDAIIASFKKREIKYLVNISVLTTGFDAPHVDLIAILRPTESVSLYQQIVGRGLRLSQGKKDCLVLDYTGQGHDLFRPEIDEVKPRADVQVVPVSCPDCGHKNEFWGLLDDDGTLIEHYGRRCHGARWDKESAAIIPCSYRFRFKLCLQCDAENDIAARQCKHCHAVIVDTDQKLREAMALKDAHVMRPDSMMFEKGRGRSGGSLLEVRYYDCDGHHLRECYSLDSESKIKSFYYAFLRFHLRIPERRVLITKVDDVLKMQTLFRLPRYIIARKKKQFWEIREKIFN